MKHFFGCLLLIALSCAPAVSLHAQQVTDAQSKQAALSDVEIQSPFMVREIKGRIYSAEREPLQGATFWIRFENGIEEGATTGSDGSFNFAALRDTPLGALTHPRLHQIIRDSEVHPGTYRFKAVKDGFHTTVGTVVVSRTAPKDSSIEIQLQPGDQQKPAAELPQKELNPRGALAGPNANAGDRKQHKYRYSDIDMPISLAPGTVQTPEFSVKGEAYFIMIQAEKRLPFRDMVCMMGLTQGPLDAKWCNEQPLLQTNWTVWDGDRLVAQGSNRTEADGEFTNDRLFKFLGKFNGEPGKKYIVQVKFTRDATPLDVANPHLIVISVRNQ